MKFRARHYHCKTIEPICQLVISNSFFNVAVNDVNHRPTSFRQLDRDAKEVISSLASDLHRPTLVIHILTSYPGEMCTCHSGTQRRFPPIH